MPMIVPYSYCSCDGRTYYCREHSESSSFCCTCHDQIHYSMFSIPVVIYLRKHVWLLPLAFIWSVLWIVITVKLISASMWFVIDLVPMIIMVLGTVLAMIIGTNVAVSALWFKKDTVNSCGIIEDVTKFIYLLSVTLPITVIIMVAMHYTGLLLLNKFPQINDQIPFAIGTCAFILISIGCIIMYVLFKMIR